MNSSTLANWRQGVKETTFTFQGNQQKYAGIFENKGYDASRSPGYLVDAALNKYVEKTTSTVYSPSFVDLTRLFVQDVDVSDKEKSLDYASGLGKDGVA